MRDVVRREIRFAVGNRTCPLSAIWKTWVQGDDLYLTTRMFGADAKVSIHASGLCQWSCTDSWVRARSSTPNAKRHIVRWSVTYPEDPNEAAYVFRVAIPASECRPLLPPVDQKKVFWIGAIPPETTLQIMFLVTGPQLKPVEVVSNEKRRFIASMPMRSGRAVVVLMELISFSEKDIAAARKSVLSQVKGERAMVNPDHRLVFFITGAPGNPHGLLEMCSTDPQSIVAPN